MYDIASASVFQAEFVIYATTSGILLYDKGWFKL